jgi:hypothetical protein
LRRQARKTGCGSRFIDCALAGSRSLAQPCHVSTTLIAGYFRDEHRGPSREEQSGRLLKAGGDDPLHSVAAVRRWSGRLRGVVACPERRLLD